MSEAITPETIHNNHDGDDDDDHEDLNHTGSAEAGVVRGVSRSLAQRALAAKMAAQKAVKLPNIGKLPKPRRMPRAKIPKAAAPKKLPHATAVKPTKVPVRKVARVTDRMSTGLDVLDALESEDGSGKTSKKNHQLARVKAFAVSMVKNSVLGAMVFETYCWVVSKSVETTKSIEDFVSTTAAPSNSVLEEDGDKKDMFDKATIPAHFLAGAVGGSIHGIGGMVWDTTAESLAARKLSLPMTSTILRSAGHHAAAHSILFGSYEANKRFILHNLQWNHNVETQELPLHQRLEYFLGITAAGGLAGQFQHVASHILEQASWRNLKPPTLSSTLWAFPPSAIAFLAFEYGKDQIAGGDDDDD